jgi:hypothetical protein
MNVHENVMAARPQVISPELLTWNFLLQIHSKSCGAKLVLFSVGLV